MKLYIGLAVAAVVVVGGYFAFSNSKAQLSDSNVENGEKTEQQENGMMAEEGSFTGSMFDLAKRGGDFKCTIAHGSDIAVSSGTVYISGEKIRGDFQSNVQGMSIDSHMIALPDALYVWSSVAPTGVKLPRSNVEGGGDASMGGQYSDYQQSYTYDCESWGADASMFSVPSSVTFTEI
jgi:hypothetical protein